MAWDSSHARAFFTVSQSLMPYISRTIGLPFQRSTDYRAQAITMHAASALAHHPQHLGERILNQTKHRTRSTNPRSKKSSRRLRSTRAKRTYTAKTADRHELYQLSVQAPE